MNSKKTLRQVAVALVLLVAFLFQGTWALAGTTGGISGTVTDVSGAPIAGATVKVVSASQTGATTTDNGGHFVFLSLSPDTYTVSAEKDQYSPVSFAGVSVFADQSQSLAFKLEKALKTIAKVTSTAAGALVKAGTTSDVYSVNAATASKVTGLGGGGSLDQAYSAIATMPGAYVPVGGAGWYQSVYIRGGDYDQVGYEVDGVPVNRAFDNYPSNTASALGQQEVQVYTGAAPSNAEGQGLSGFINQVIKTGTYPGFAGSDLGIGSPIFYHKANVEAGGASPDRLFSYYAAFGGYNQGYRVVDGSNGSSYDNNYGYLTGATCPAPEPADTTGLGSCFNSAGTYESGGSGSNWFVLGPYNYYSLSQISDRENVMNFHFAIPHHKDSGRDDLQLLYQASDLVTKFYSTQNDLAAQLPYAGGPFSYPLSATYSGGFNQLFSPTAPASAYAPVVPYCFPSVSATVGCGGTIAPNTGDDEDNAVGILKLQYQKNFGSNAYLRMYGYTTYSNWFNYGPVSASLCCAGIPVEYEVYTHTKGVSATLADQLNSKNLVQAQVSYSDSNSNRINNGTMFAGLGTHMAVLVDGSNPNSGICYTLAGAPGNCDGHGTTGAAYFKVGALQAAQAGSGTLPAVTAAACGGGPCMWDVVDSGYNGRANTVEPRFGSGSITDEWDPTDRLHINLGLRYDSFQYIPSDSNGGARPFWNAAWNNSYCVDNSVIGANPQEKSDPTQPCTSLGATFVPATVTTVSNTQTYTETQPRIAATYTLNPTNVLRFSYGKYDQAPNTAFEQYDSLNQNLPNANANFYSLGFYAPTHPIRPEVSYNTDFSWEHQVKGSDVSWKISPFYRKTRDQIQQFYLDIRTNFVSGLNVGSQTSEGVEFQLQKGDFSRNGLSGLLSYTYTNAYVTYSPASNGSTPATGIDQTIANYNAETAACNGGSAAGTSQFGIPVCTPGTQAFPCYSTAGVGLPQASCTAADVANPYWNAPVQGFLDPAGKYAPYDLFAGPAPGAGGYSSFVAPHVATLVLNYKHDKFAITPALQFSGGTKYGYPISTLGIDPSTCTATLGSVSGDPRYPNGGFGSSYDAGTCAQNAIPIPNPATGHFDGVGAFTQPNRLTLATQLSYDVSPRVSAVLTLSNIVDTCFGGTKAPWTGAVGVSQSKICGYGGGYSGVGVPPIGNNYNPPAALNVQPFQANSYLGQPGTLPFNAYLDFKIKL